MLKTLDETTNRVALVYHGPDSLGLDQGSCQARLCLVRYCSCRRLGGLGAAAGSTAVATDVSESQAAIGKVYIGYTRLYFVRMCQETLSSSLARLPRLVTISGVSTSVSRLVCLLRSILTPVLRGVVTRESVCFADPCDCLVFSLHIMYIRLVVGSGEVERAGKSDVK